LFRNAKSAFIFTVRTLNYTITEALSGNTSTIVAMEVSGFTFVAGSHGWVDRAELSFVFATSAVDNIIAYKRH
jgi:hypothetical protein